MQFLSFLITAGATIALVVLLQALLMSGQSREKRMSRLKIFCTLVMLSSGVGLACAVAAIWDSARSPRAIALAMPMATIFVGGLVSRCMLERGARGLDA